MAYVMLFTEDSLHDLVETSITSYVVGFLLFLDFAFFASDYNFVEICYQMTKISICCVILLQY